ncbi:hypothetical protein A7982_12927 [Minicystis rosea]|nr:hypothetical protein A7982_12927 [Minicystis rosea]
MPSAHDASSLPAWAGDARATHAIGTTFAPAGTGRRASHRFRKARSSFGAFAVKSTDRYAGDRSNPRQARW